MKLENMYNSLRIWKITAILLILASLFFFLFYASVFFSNAERGYYFSFDGERYISRDEGIAQMMTVIVITSVLEICSLFVARLFGKAAKSASKYGLTVNQDALTVLCDGRETVLPLSEVDSFAVLPKNCEPENFNSIWAEVGMIVARGETYKLYYLKNMSRAKSVFESFRAK